MATRKQIKPEDFLYVFYRPNEPLFFPKEDAGNRVLFIVPQDVLGSRLQDAALEVQERFGIEGLEQISLTSNIRLPDISNLEVLKKDDSFSLFIPFHRKLAAYLIDILIRLDNLNHLMLMVADCVKRLNPLLLNYALSVALLHRPDTKHLDLPPLFESFPSKFFQAPLISRARTEAEVFNKPEKREVTRIPKDFTASDRDPEHRLWYFREDLGINLHHWHWHLVYPNEGRVEIVDKDRRGELFYYMHQQVIARYNFERFCNRLYRVERLLDWTQPIPEAYFPKLTDAMSAFIWPSRPPNARLSNINRKAERLQVDLNDLQRWRERLYEAIHHGYIFLKDGTQKTIMGDDGIDILGNLVESSLISNNSDYYGDLHNKGHMVIAYVHDPEHRFLERYSVMGDSATAMRDPVFYRWHAFIDDIFQAYKNKLEPYEDDKLKFDKIKVKSLEISSVDGTKNEFNTFWQRSVVNLTKGMDFAPRGDVPVEVVHLQHKTFTYSIEVENQSNRELKGTIRIFLAPHFDERGEEMIFNDQRLLFIELDKFTWTFKPKKNHVTRSSKDSSVTIPFERTFRNLDTKLTGEAERKFNFCGCGWPEHMLIPKGTVEGYPCQLFVMISNYEDDKIEQNIEGSCADAASYCGIRDKLYPDKRTMGFPFDRRAPANIPTLEEFTMDYPNMLVKDINIIFTDKIVDRNP